MKRCVVRKRMSLSGKRWGEVQLVIIKRNTWLTAGDEFRMQRGGILAEEGTLEELLNVWGGIPSREGTIYSYRKKFHL